MKLSVIIISYNEKKYLSKAVESCLQQDYEGSYEIIIGDDGSDDGSFDIIQEFEAKYPEKVRCFVMDRDNAEHIIPSFRVSNVLKRAFEMINGEYIICLSGDDYFCDVSKFRKQIDFMDKYPEYESCYTGYKMIWDNGKEIVVRKNSHISNALFWSGDYVHISCFMFRRNTLGYLLDRFCDDTGLIFSSFKAGKSYCMPDCTFAYRQRDRSIMHEADKLELAILEVLLYQDVMNEKGYYFSSISRYIVSLSYVFKHRHNLEAPRYVKYFDSSRNYPHDYLNAIKDYENKGVIYKCGYNVRTGLAKCIRILFWLLRKGVSLLGYNNKKC